MSKAFTRESDDIPERPLVRPPSLPAGQNYLTPDGAQRLREELATLIKEAGEKNARVVELQELLSSATVVPPPPSPWNHVAFGAVVTVRETSGEASEYRIVGPAEVDLDKNWIAAATPIGRALLKATVGQQIKFRIPAGEQNWEIVEIRY